MLCASACSVLLIFVRFHQVLCARALRFGVLHYSAQADFIHSPMQTIRHCSIFVRFHQHTPSQVQCDDADTGFQPTSLPKGSTNDALMASNVVDSSLSVVLQTIMQHRSSAKEKDKGKNRLLHRVRLQLLHISLRTTKNLENTQAAIEYIHSLSRAQPARSLNGTGLCPASRSLSTHAATTSSTPQLKAHHVKHPGRHYVKQNRRREELM
ncbi:hypothetical protein ZEAMMB73_Zm00001d030603 [Zea mays]|uniref:Uncharacterized protein n=1 Tax=Zea mays TaxID=4577 RepID=A0A1D6KD45_MAIZE|nr:hypothetical protein ZEAMMB73_Zm00001d030603 [Zea mays]